MRLAPGRVSSLYRREPGYLPGEHRGTLFGDRELRRAPADCRLHGPRHAQGIRTHPAFLFRLCQKARLQEGYARPQGQHPETIIGDVFADRSEERRVGKEYRSMYWAYHLNI